MSELIPLLPPLLVAGALAGLLAGLLGVGGGIVLVPALFETLTTAGYPEAPAIKLATATSLAIIVPTALSSARSHRQRGNVDVELLTRWAPAMLVGVVAGVLLVRDLSAEPLLALFGVVMLMAALNLLLRPDNAALLQALPGRLWQWLMAAVIGFVCVLIGIGAGTLGVATLTACGVPVQRAVGTAAALGLVIAAPGALMHLMGPAVSPAPAYTLGHVSLPAALVVGVLASACAPLGVRLGGRLGPARLQRVFALFLLLVGVRMLWRSLT